MSFMHTVLNTTKVEIPLCLLDFSSHQTLHGGCLSDLCTDNGGSICLTPTMKNYLKSQKMLFSNQRRFPGIRDHSDWHYLAQAVKDPKNHVYEEILGFFASSSSHRLRLKEHRDLGISLIAKLISELKTFFQSFGSVWGTPYSDQQHIYSQLFKSLCAECEHSSVGGIYRLYDLCEGHNYANKRTLPYHFHLALLFAFDHGISKKPEIKSIPQLVAKFQFYKTFAEKLKKEIGYINKDLFIKKLASEKVGQIAYNLWRGYLKAGSVIGWKDSACLKNNHRTLKLIEANNKKLLSHREERELVFQLKQDLSVPLTLPRSSFILYRQSKVSPFKNAYEAAYHPLKHQGAANIFFESQDVSKFFFGKRVRLPTLEEYSDWSEKDFAEYAFSSLRDYCTIIDKVIVESSSYTTQPSQFDSAEVLKFSCQRQVEGEMCTFLVISTVYPQGHSYTLTCYKR